MSGPNGLKTGDMLCCGIGKDLIALRPSPREEAEDVKLVMEYHVTGPASYYDEKQMDWYYSKPEGDKQGYLRKFVIV